MKKFLQKRLNNEKGLTLVELLAVIVILGIIAAIAVPSIGNIIENSKYNAVKADALNVLNAAQLYYVDNPDAATGVTPAGLKTAKFLESFGSIPENATITKLNPHAITADAITYATGKTVKLTGATITGINDAAFKKPASSGDVTTINK